MSDFNRSITPLNIKEVEVLANGNSIEYEFFLPTIDITGPLLYQLFQEHWSEVGLGHMVAGSVLELEFNQPPKICRVYDGYLTVVAQEWHMHLCLEENRGGPEERTPQVLRDERLVSKAALYRRLNDRQEPRSWGIQFWNGSGEKMMNIFLPNPFVGDQEDLLPENRPNLAKLALYDRLRQIYILGEAEIPYETNPLHRPYLSVCRSTRCTPNGNWQPVYDALQSAVNELGLDIEVINSGCLEVCKMGPVAFYSGENGTKSHTWYTRVTPEVAKEIVRSHVIKGEPVTKHLYPQPAKSIKSSSDQQQ
jgi:(2Fe-2S) ferredoxin